MKPKVSNVTNAKPLTFILKIKFEALTAEAFDSQHDDCSFCLLILPNGVINMRWFGQQQGRNSFLLIIFIYLTLKECRRMKMTAKHSTFKEFIPKYSVESQIYVYVKIEIEMRCIMIMARWVLKVLQCIAHSCYGIYNYNAMQMDGNVVKR